MKLKSLFGVAFALILSASLTTFASAQDDDEGDGNEPPLELPKATDVKAAVTKQADKKDEQAKRDPASLEYEKAVKDLEKVEGVFTFYKRKKDTLLELPESKLNKMFLIQATMETGVTSFLLQAGDPIGGNDVDTYRFERHDEQIWLVRPNFRYRWSDNDLLRVAAERSMPHAILGSFRVEQKDPERHLVLINVSGLFSGEPFQLNDAVNFMVGGQYSLDREKSGVDEIKSFPDNTVVRTHLHYFSPRGSDGNSLANLFGIGGDQLEDSRSIPMKVTYNLWFRKDDGYVPRYADGRVGYFTDDFYDMSKFLERDRTSRYIFRFNLKKKDPSASHSEPVKPIVFTIDPSVPEKYREAVKEGILRWNRAFEDLGYKNAVQVQDAPKDDKDYDHADGRYNVVRWTVSEDAGYAVALARTDPFTGQVLNASVTVDANMLSYILNDYQVSTSAITAAHTNGIAALLRDPSRKVTEDSFLWSNPRETAARQMNEKLSNLGWNRFQCQEPQGLASSAAFTFATLQALGTPVDKEAYARQYIADVVCHEVGHTLGLRHNFAGSTYLSTDQLSDDELTSKENVAASVMDYVPVNMAAVLKGRHNLFSTTVGAYDRWAISYGYADFGANSPDTEKSRLSQIAAKSGQPGLAYMTDENADNWDPFAVRFDNAKDPLVYSQKNLEAAKRLRKYAVTFLPRPGQSFDERTQLILTSIARTFREGRMSSRFVGGITASRSYKGDAVEHPTLAPVDPDLQREAMSLIVNNCLAADAFDLPESVLDNLSLDPSKAENANWNAPIREILSAQQMLTYAAIMNAGTTDRISENAYKWRNRKGAYTMDQHFALALGAVFKEVGQNKPIPPLRRDLQRFAVTALMAQAGALPGQISDDARTVASDALKRLVLRYKVSSKQAILDDMTRVYLRDTADTIDRFLNRSISSPK